MKKLFLLLFLVPFSSVRGQFFLQFGDPDIIPRVVQTPYVYTDALRNSADAWVEEVLHAGNWVPLYRVVSRKNNDGYFTELSNMQWSSVNWQVMQRYLYYYTKNSQNEIVERQCDLEGPSTPDWKIMFTYGSGKITGFDFQSFINNNYITTSTGFYFYDGSGNRVKDSVATGSQSRVNYYQYDGSGRCTRRLDVSYTTTTDTLAVDSFFYNGSGKLEKLISLFDVTTYTYAANGQVEEVLQSSYNTARDTLTPYAYYRHTYNAQGKIAAMVYKQYGNNKWDNKDSLVNSFTAGGDYDTGYIYRGSFTNWVNSKDKRIVYGLVSTSIQPVQQTVIKSIYPNPANDRITIELAKDFTGKEVFITDVAGITIMRWPVNGLSAEIPLDIKPGLYFLHAGGHAARFVKR